MKTLSELCAMMQNCNAMQDFGRLVTLAYLLMQTKPIAGDAIEMGCHEGRTVAFLSSISSKRFWCYDSFEGLPPRSEHDKGARSDFIAGAVKTSVEALHKTFTAALLPPPTIVSKWFMDITPDDLPPRIAFAHLDSDFFASIACSLKLIYRKLTPGAIVVIDDFGWSGLPGVEAAVTQFLQDKPEKLVRPWHFDYQANQVFFVKA